MPGGFGSRGGTPSGPATFTSGGGFGSQGGVSTGPTTVTRAGGFGSRATTPTKKSGGHGFLHGLVHNPATTLVGNFGKDVGNTAIGVLPGAYDLGKAAVLDERDMLQGKNAHRTLDILKGVGKGYENYYGHNLFGHLYQHPLQPVLDVLTAADVGLGAGSKIAKVTAPESGLAKLGERGTTVTRSPRNIATGKGPVTKELTSTRPLVHLRQNAAARVRARFPEGRTTKLTVAGRPVKVPLVGGELKRSGKLIQAEATHTALKRTTALDAYTKAVKRLSADEWTALHIRAMDIHPDDLAKLWKGTPNEAALTPKVRELSLHPSNRMVRAEPEFREISAQGARLYRQTGKLTAETEAARPGKTKAQAAEVLGRPVKEITGEPYYFPHTTGPVPYASPLEARGGGRGPQQRLGSTKENKGVLALAGKLHLRSDVLGPEFLRRVTRIKYEEIHNALRRGAVRITRAQLEEHHGGKLPNGWEYLREKPSTRIPFDLRGEGEKPVPIDKLIPNPDDLRESPLSEGFSTTDAARAHTDSKGGYYIVPKATVKAATGEFTRSSKAMYVFNKYPMKFWRAVVLGLRVGFLTNNLVGNSIMYAVKVGGNGALRDLFGAIVESHGRDTALRILKNPATPPGLRADLYREFFPEQVHGTFGRTQSPATSPAHIAGQKIAEGARTVTGALPRLTSKVAEEYPRRALIRNAIRRSPEFKRVYSQLPRQTRSFETAARKLLEGKGGKQYQRYISKQVNQALGDYLNLSRFEREVMRNTFPFYSWYRAITVTTAHLAADTPLRANILGQLGQLGKQQSDADLAQLGGLAGTVAEKLPVPSFLEGAIGLGHGPDGTVRAVSTQGLNPYATLGQIIRGSTTDLGALGLNPLVQGALDTYANKKTSGISPGALAAKTLEDIIAGLPPSQLVAPRKPSKLYPTRDRTTTGLSFLGVPIKEYNPQVAAQQAKQGR